MDIRYVCIAAKNRPHTALNRILLPKHISKLIDPHLQEKILRKTSEDAEVCYGTNVKIHLLSTSQWVHLEIQISFPFREQFDINLCSTYPIPIISGTNVKSFRQVQRNVKGPNIVSYFSPQDAFVPMAKSLPVGHIRCKERVATLGSWAHCIIKLLPQLGDIDYRDNTLH